MMAWSVVASGAAILALAGIAGALSHGWVFLALRNEAGIPRALPIGMAAALLAAALLSWVEQFAFRALIAFWALAAACYARPGLEAIGIGIRLEPLLVAVAVLCAVLALRLDTSAWVRSALAAAPLVVVCEAVVLLLPAHPALDGAAYSIVLGAAALSARAAHAQRRYQCHPSH